MLCGFIKEFVNFPNPIFASSYSYMFSTVLCLLYMILSLNLTIFNVSNFAKLNFISMENSNI